MARKKGFTLTRAWSRARAMKGLTQADVARRTKTDQGTVSRLESGEHGMRVDRARRFAKALGLTLERALEAGLIAWPADARSASSARRGA